MISLLEAQPIYSVRFHHLYLFDYTAGHLREDGFP